MSSPTRRPLTQRLTIAAHEYLVDRGEPATVELIYEAVRAKHPAAARPSVRHALQNTSRFERVQVGVYRAIAREG